MSVLFDFSKDPLDNFEILFADVESKIEKDPEAMSLATVNSQGQPSLRTVLFKGLRDRCFSFVTNYESQKAKELTDNPKVALLFFWASLEMQVRIEGQVQAFTAEESDAYFKTRPRLSQIGSWASRQSQKIDSYQALQAKVDALEKQYEGKDIPRPPYWGGYKVCPQKIEFWFGRSGRLHERYVYERSSPQAPWERYLKSP